MTIGIADQLSLDAMPVRLYPVTPTKLANWSDCPRKFRFTYLQRLPKGGPWAHSTMGGAVHNALKQWWDVPLSRRTPQRAAGLVHEAWVDEGFRDRDQSAQWRQRASEMVAGYVTGIDPEREPLGIERTVGVPVMSMALSGRVDRIDELPSETDGREGASVVDYKTGRTMLSRDDVRGSAALALYAVAVARTLRRSCTQVELHHLPSGQVHTWNHTQESLARQVKRANDVAIEAQRAHETWRAGLDVHATRVGQTANGVIADPEVDAVLPPKPSVLCGWCDFRRWCPEGRAAAPAKQPWDGLATDE